MTHEEFIAEIEKMTVLELNDLVKALEEKFGVSAAAAVVAAPAAGGAAAAAEEKTEFDVVLKGSRLRKDQGYQGCSRSGQRPGPEGSQGHRRKRSQDPQRSRFQGRSRKDQGKVFRSRRDHRNSIIIHTIKKPPRWFRGGFLIARLMRALEATGRYRQWA